MQIGSNNGEIKTSLRQIFEFTVVTCVGFISSCSFLERFPWKKCSVSTQGEIYQLLISFL